MFSRLVSLALIGAALSPAGAQIMRAAPREPAAWTSLGLGLLRMGSVSDKQTSSTWSFGESLQYRATLEKALGGSGGIGVVATFAQAPLTYIQDSGVQTNATANVWGLAAGVHMGGGPSVHQVIQLNVGATAFGNFRDDDTGDPLPPAEFDLDLSFHVGYGIGYTISERWQASLVQEYGFIVHPGNGEGSSSSTVQVQTTRLAVRYGLGTKGVGKPGIRRR